MGPSTPEVVVDALRELRPRLEALEAAEIPDAWLAAGAIRNRVWNRLFGNGGPPDTDWDVAYTGPMSEDEAESRLLRQLRGPWEAVDQGRFGHASAVAGLASWPETATAIGARLRDGAFELIVPWGFDDLLAGRVRPAPGFADLAAFRERLRKKRWLGRWPALKEAPQVGGEPDLEPRVVSPPRASRATQRGR